MYIAFDSIISLMLFLVPREYVSYKIVLNVSSKGSMFSDIILISFNGGLNVCQVLMDKYSGISSFIASLDNKYARFLFKWLANSLFGIIYLSMRDSIFFIIVLSDIFNILLHGSIELLSLLAIQATYAIDVLSCSPSNGYPLNDLIQPGKVFLVCKDGMFI